MSRHRAFAIAEEEARRALARLDWPGSLAVDPDALSCARRWVPVHRSTGRSLLPPDDPLVDLALPVPLLVEGGTSAGPPPEATPDPIPSAPHGEDGDVLHAPFYVFTEPGRSGERGAVVDGNTGVPVAGRLTAATGPTVARLGVLLLLALFGFFVATAYAHLLLATLMGTMVPALAFVATPLRVLVVTLLLVLLGILFRWMRRRRGRLLDGLAEATRRLDTGVVSLPLDLRWRRLVSGAGILCAILVPLIGLSWLAFAAASMMGVPGLAPSWVLLRLLQAVAAFGFWRLARRVARPRRLEAPAPTTSLVRNPDPGRASRMVRVLFDVALLALFGAMVGHLADLLDVGGMIRERGLPELTLLAGIGARLGAIAGLAASEVTWRHRSTAVVALTAELCADLFLDTWTGLALLVVVVTVAAGRVAARRMGTVAAAVAGLRTAWILTLGLALASLLGGAVGLVFLGPAGMVVGEMLGDAVVAVAILFLVPGGEAARVAAIVAPDARTRPAPRESAWPESPDPDGAAPAGGPDR